MRTRTHQRAATGTGRFARSGAATGDRGRRARSAPARRPVARSPLDRVPFRGGHAKQSSGVSKLVDDLTGRFANPKGANKPASGGKAKGVGGVAALAGLAGLAFKNRSKLAGMLGQARHRGGSTPSEAPVPVDPALAR